LIIVDIVTSRHANLHDELTAMYDAWAAFTFPANTHLYATAYRPVNRDGRNEIDLWRERPAVGRPLPTLPLGVRRLGCLPVDFELTYLQAAKRGRIVACGEE
jgi:hypothetical protein